MPQYICEDGRMTWELVIYSTIWDSRIDPVIRFDGRNFYPLNHLGLHYWHFKARVGADHN